METIKNMIPRFNRLSHHNDSRPFTTPTYQDVRTVRALLKTLQLPTELVLIIIDLAHYWPTHEFKLSANRPIRAAAQGHQLSSAMLCLEANIFNNPAINYLHSGGERIKIKSIQFDITSQDQGWTSQGTNGTYSTSSWLEVSILRSVTGDMNSLRLPDGPYSSPQAYHETILDQGWSLVERSFQEDEDEFAWYLQGNRVAAAQADYRVVWSEDGPEGNEGAGKGEGFLQELKEGDIVLVWARAQWSGWQCVVENAKMTVYYGF